MSAPLVYHDTQWPRIENGGKCFSEALNKLHGDDLLKYFTELEVFATVKFDGTNVAKCAKSGKLLGRRIYIDPTATSYIKTSLDPVKKSDVQCLMEKILEEIQIQDRTCLGEFVVYGELMCNNYYEYEKLGLTGTWQVFGAVLEDSSGGEEVLEKLLNAGYTVRIMKKDASGKKIQFLMNQKLYALSKSCGLTVAPQSGEGKTIDVIVKENKDWMKKGQGEGIVITMGNKEEGFRLVKWKGGHEAQDRVDGHIQSALDKLRTMDIDDRILNTFIYFKEVIDEGAKNKEEKKKNLKNKAAMDDAIANALDDAIDDAIASALTKFDSPSVYVEKGETKKFKELIIEEVTNDIGQANSKLIAKKVWSLKVDAR
ncbi:hypothetical protein [carnivorous sponge associated iridovirus]|jgi:hypothetical protein|nr:hypothetical protein [carnivorous sponge associated iridovirus]